MGGPVVADKPATDPDGDGLYEDVTGDQEVTPGDADVLFDAVFEENPAVMNNPKLFDFSGDGEIAPGDADVLFDKISSGTAVQQSASSDGRDSSQQQKPTSDKPQGPTGLDALKVSLSSPTYRVGQRHRVEATLRNRGKRAISPRFNANIVFDGQPAPIQQRQVTIKPGETRTITFRSSGPYQGQPGDYSIELRAQAGGQNRVVAETTATIEPPEQPEQDQQQEQIAESSGSGLDGDTSTEVEEPMSGDGQPPTVTTLGPAPADGTPTAQEAADSDGSTSGGLGLDGVLEDLPVEQLAIGLVLVGGVIAFAGSGGSS